jgi:hypothetical protein
MSCATVGIALLFLLFLEDNDIVTCHLVVADIGRWDDGSKMEATLRIKIPG